MRGCLDHSAIWSRTKIWRRKRSSLVWASAISSGRIAGVIAGTSVSGQESSANDRAHEARLPHDFAQAAHQAGRLFRPEPFDTEPKSFESGGCDFSSAGD